jgi:hypothetical protein
MYLLISNLLPEARLLFRAGACAVLALVAFAVPIAAGWWLGLALSYMAFNLVTGKLIANFSDAIYRIVTRQHLDRRFAQWQQRYWLFHPELPENAYDLFLRGMSPREAADIHILRKQDALPENFDELQSSGLSLSAAVMLSRRKPADKRDQPAVQILKYPREAPT